MARTYYTLLVRDNKDADWTVHFGDYDRSVVVDERADITEHEYSKGNTKIIGSDDDQASIDEAVRVQNIRFETY